MYQKNGWNSFISLSLLPYANLNAFVGDVDMIKEITNDRVRFPKPLEAMSVLQVYGLVSHTLILDQLIVHDKFKSVLTTEAEE